MNAYFNSNIEMKEKLDGKKKAGFDEFFTGIYDKKETMTWKEQMEYAKKNWSYLHDDSLFLQRAIA